MTPTPRRARGGLTSSGRLGYSALAGHSLGRMAGDSLSRAGRGSVLYAGLHPQSVEEAPMTGRQALLSPAPPALLLRPSLTALDTTGDRPAVVPKRQSTRSDAFSTHLPPSKQSANKGSRAGGWGLDPNPSTRRQPQSGHRAGHAAVLTAHTRVSACPHHSRAGVLSPASGQRAQALPRFHS